MKDQQNFIIQKNNLIKKIDEYGITPLEIDSQNISNKIFLKMADIDAFLSFVKGSNTQYVYYHYSYFSVDNYIIPNDWYDEQVKAFQDEAAAHNKFILSMDFTRPKSLLMFVLDNAHFVGITLFDNWLKDKDIENAEVTIDKLEEKYYKEVKEVKENKIVNKKENEKQLREIIFNDPEFKYCKNQELRYHYLIDLLEEDEDLMNKYGYLVDPYGAPQIGKVKMFMDKAWMFYLEKKK